MQVITRKASTRVAEFAFKYAQDHNRKLVSAVHKANIMKKADGLFLECCRCEGGSGGSEAAQGSETALTAAAQVCSTYLRLRRHNGRRGLLGAFTPDVPKLQ